MNMNEHDEEIEHLKQLKSECRKRLRALELKSARFGTETPAHMEVEINDIGDQLIEIDAKIADLQSSANVPRKEPAIRHIYSPVAPNYHLQIRTGSRAGERIDLISSRIIVGQSPDCDIVINDAYFSRSHFALNWDLTEKNFVLIDFGSTNGVLVNNQFVKGQRKLESGDIISVGNTIMAFLDPRNLPKEFQVPPAL